MRDAWLGKTSTNGRYEDPVTGPSVVVRNANGEKQVLERTRTVREARHRATAIERDLEALTTPQWCARYDVPPSFASG
jgi:hypothetical protein